MSAPNSNLQLAIYGLPAITISYMMTTMVLYVMKYSTDVLLVTPALIGLIFGLSRVWDAITDPIVGSLNDLTRSSMGRRRIWMLIGALPAAMFYALIFSSPHGMGEGTLILWLGVSIFGFFTAMTTIVVPHYSLGAEVTREAHGRNQLFGVRHAFNNIGSVVALLSISWLIFQEGRGPPVIREAAAELSWIAAVLLLITVMFMVWRFREPPPSRHRPKGNLWAAGRDILRNSHARLILLVTFIENIGMASISSSCLYVTQYVIGVAAIAPLSIITFLMISGLSVPIWVRLSKRYGKVRLWLASMIATAIAFGLMFSIVFINSWINQSIVIVILAALAGFASGCGNTMSPSLLSDIIDHDELHTGERKEGSYFAVWTFTQKSASGVTLMITGFTLSATGFIPNQEQTFTVQVALCSLLGLFPMTCYMLGSMLFARFRLDEASHREVLTALDARNT